MIILQVISLYNVPHGRVGQLVRGVGYYGV
jgi:hypothetical protein